ncbi:hypothetical protein QFC19_002835 [Naganishia cerealis]|uniref:Uncharacterized protein n=1 Tax=Naganishia cerealis TaxID=610337 RepID=A0ACC2W7V2_9TREE|nr:hypothetical protein QFC19_002835 [Naganishia cerealis]
MEILADISLVSCTMIGDKSWKSLKRSEFTPDVTMWKWRTSDAIQDVLDVESANIALSEYTFTEYASDLGFIILIDLGTLELSFPAKAFSLMLAHISPGYMSNDTSISEATSQKTDDREFRDHLGYAIEVFGAQDICAIMFKVTKSEVMDELRNSQGLTLAPIVYERLYLSLRAKLPQLWCKGEEKACLASDTRTLFSHVTHLNLTETTTNILDDDKLQKIFNVGDVSPVFLKDGETLSVITGIDEANESWKGFDVNAPRSIKRWNKTQLKDTSKPLSVIFSDSHLPLPLNMPLQQCAWPACFVPFGSNDC